MALVLVGVLAITVAATAALWATGLVPGRSGPSVRSQAEAAAERFLDTYVEADGRVVRRDQGGDTVSEGQGYAMLLAVATDDSERFELTWRWTEDNLLQDDGLLAFRWADGAVVDANAATDAELDVIRALVVAASRFDRADYRGDAERLALAVERDLVVDTGSHQVLLPGSWADDTTDGIVLNPSYYAPRSFRLLERLRPGGPWPSVTETARAFVAELTRARRLPPDWARLEHGELRPVAEPGGDRGEGRYSYDAVRLPVRYAESCRSQDRDLAAALWPVIERLPAASVRELDGSDVTGERHASALVGAAAAAAASGQRERSTELLAEATALDDQRPTYYGSAWIALGRVLLDTDLLGAC